MFGILGTNKRYLKYIKPLNPKKDIKLADSKLKTKIFLKNLDIPHPKLLDIIKNRKQLKNYDFSRFLNQDFVIKPNKGSKGKGIMICSVIKNNNDIFIKAGNNILTDEEFKKHLSDILDGKYSLTLGNDIILIEEKIEPSEEFKLFCKYGLADIRLITMNLIPVMAMLRYPTKESHGKANIAAGGIGFGIDIGSGEITSIYKNKKIYTKSFPQEYQKFHKKQIPYWDDILLYSSQVQYFTNIGYLGLDWVISTKGPMLLEINARAGMEIQLVNGEGLEKRLRKITDIHISSPSKGVEIGKTLFSKKQTNPTIQKDIIYLEQPAKLKIKEKENTIYKDVILKVDLDNKVNYADPNLITNFDKKYTLLFNDLIWDEVKFSPKKGLKNIITLGTKELEDFIIIPQKKDIRNFNIWIKTQINPGEENILIELDNGIDQISKKLNLSKYLKPTNYLEELDNFITWNGNYNPKFDYKYPSEKKIIQIEDDLKSLKEKYFDIKSEYTSCLLELFKTKLQELEYKCELIKAYKKQDFTNIKKYNKLLYGEINNELLHLANQKTNLLNLEIKHTKKKLSIKNVILKIKQHLKKRGIENVKIKIESDSSSRVLVKRGDPIIISISKFSNFYENEIDMILAHEIDVHVIRYVNGKKTGWKILQSGTGFYLTDEEGLAIRNSFNYLPNGIEKKGIYESYLLISKAEELDFVNLVNLIRALHPQTALVKIFRKALRYKKGIKNTAFRGEGTTYYKDKVYLDGYEKVKKRIEKGGKFEDMLKGKYKIEDLKYINNTSYDL